MANVVELGISDIKFRLLGVKLKVVGEDLEVVRECLEKLSLISWCVEKSCKVSLYEGNEEVLNVSLTDSAQLYRAGPTIVFLRFSHGSAIITMATQNDTLRLLTHLESTLPSKAGNRSKQSVFSMRTEESSAKQYFQFYGYLSQQQNMLQDYVRTGTYQSAMLQNTSDFKDKVVLDVGAGTGVLSFFALQAGARKVYAIEASNMAIHCRKLVTENKFADKMSVIIGKVEEVDVPEQVDMIISEPMGYMLFNERMLETYLHAKKWLKPGGKMFPTKGILYVAPFNDEALYLEQFSKANFWAQNSFHGIDVSSLREEALIEYFKQPVLDTFDVRIVTAKPVSHTTDFLEADETDLLKIVVPLEYKMWTSGMVHGLAFWFDCAFCGSESCVWLSTAPFQPLTHWYQIRLLLPSPLFVHKNQGITGILRLVANERQSYDVTVELDITGTGIKLQSSYDLKNPNFRYMTTAPSVPGTLHANPTDTYYHDVSGSQMVETSTSPYLDNHTATSTTSQHSNAQTAVMMSSNISSSPAQMANPASSQSLLGTSPSLNPAAPQFVPLPEHRLPANSGILMTPSSRGFYQSNGLYMMGSQQVVYSQCLPGIGGSNVIPSLATASSGEKENLQRAFQNQTSVDSLHCRLPYGVAARNHYY